MPPKLASDNSPLPSPLLPTQEEAGARLQFAVEHGHKLALLFGPPGSGKSSLVAHLAAQYRREGKLAAVVSLAGLNEAEVLFAILAALGMNPSQDATSPELWRRLGDQLLALRWQDCRAVLFFDDLAAALPSTLVALQRLFALDTSLTIIAAAESLSRAKLPRTWLELAELRADLEPLTEDETNTFVTRTDAAAKSSPHFTADAVTTMHTLTAGLPRQLDQLQRLVTIAAEGSGSSTIDAATIEQVYRELFVAPRG